MNLHIDIETYSPVDLKKSSVYRYAEECEVIIFAYRFEGQRTVVIDMTKRDLPALLKIALTDRTYKKIAHNAAFERACISKYFHLSLPPEQWQCSQVLCANAGLPLALEQATRVLRSRVQKDPAGKALIRYFCMPCKPTKTNGGRTRNLPEHDFEKWEKFKKYCGTDVDAECENYAALSYIEISDFEKRLWYLDQRINDRGVKIDKTLVDNALSMNEEFREKLTAEALRISGIDNMNSLPQLKAWLQAEENDTPEFETKFLENEMVEIMTSGKFMSLTKDKLPGIIENLESNRAKRVLSIRQDLSKTSVKKYAAMLKGLQRDGRVRGLLQFYGANRTGRWAGRLVQVQNLPKSKMASSSLNNARNLVIRDDDREMFEIIYGAVPDALSQLIRTAFIAEEGKRFIISDFSAIEARVIAWLASEKWRLEVFETHGRIYEASASQMFKVPIEAVTKTSDYRAKGKIAELALGYQGSVAALIKMGALKMGLEESELQSLVDAWREANPKIKKFWYNVGDAAVLAVQSGERVTMIKGLFFELKKGNLIIGLPSGRKLCYYRASVVDGLYGPVVAYWGMDQTTKQWSKIVTYGGKLVENIVQATARDCLANGMINLHKAGYTIVMHVHDEIVCEEKIGFGSLEEVNRIFIDPAPWMKGLPLAADGFESAYYKKDE